MRLVSNVTILLTVATRPVEVGAHAEPSDVVSSDGRFEVPVKRHLRVQERTHDADDDERIFPVNDAVAVLKRGPEPLVPRRPSKNPRVGNGMDDFSQTWQQIFDSHGPEPLVPGGPSQNPRVGNGMDDLSQTWQQIFEKYNSDNSIKANGVKRAGEPLEPEYRPGKVSRIDDVEDISWPTNLKDLGIEDQNRLNEQIGRALRKQKDAYDQRQLTDNSLFEQPDLVAWVEKVDMFNAAFPNKRIPLLVRLLEHYSAKQLVYAVAKTPTNNLAMRVQDGMHRAWFRQSVTPDKVFTQLNLDKVKGDLFDSPLFPFYMKYWMYYQSKFVKQVSVLETYSVEMLPTVFGKIQTADYTRRVEEEMEGKLLKMFHQISFQKAREYVLKMEQAADKGSVYESALQKAMAAYVRQISSWRSV